DHHSTGAVCTSFPRHQGRPHPGRSPGGYGLGLNWTAQTIPGPPATPRSESAPTVGEIDDHAHLLYPALDWAKEPAAPLWPRALSYAAHPTPSAELGGVFADFAAQLSARVTRRRTTQRSRDQEAHNSASGAAGNREHPPVRRCSRHRPGPHSPDLE